MITKNVPKQLVNNVESFMFVDSRITSKRGLPKKIGFVNFNCCMNILYQDSPSAERWIFSWWMQFTPVPPKKSEKMENKNTSELESPIFLNDLI